MSKDVKCPYCSVDIEICHDDGFGYEEDKLHEYECSQCGKNFVFDTSISISHEAYKADCLNDGNHEYQLTNTSPIEAALMRCSMCGNERMLTNQEREKYGIGSLEDYFKSLKQ